MARLPASHITATPPDLEPPLPDGPVPPPQVPHYNTERAARIVGRLDLVLAAIVLALAFALASFAVRNNDFWFHIATGRYIAGGNTTVLFGTDPFSHATAGRHWANQAWLFDLASYLIYTADPTGAAIVVFKSIIVVLLAGVMLLACQPPAAERIVPGKKANPAGWFAALFTGVALVAMVPRLLMQPAMVSLLFLAATFWLLNRDWGTDRPSRLVIAIGLLFALWVNCDAWFLLGPLLVLMFLLGELAQRWFPGKNTVVAPGRLRVLASALGIGLAACLVSPHHIYAFTLPADLSQWKLAPALLQERIYAAAFYKPISDVYWNTPDLGKNLSGLCYLILLVLGLGACALNVAHLRWSLVLTWLALAGLSLTTWRAIPFFAVVAAPIAVLNLNAWFARRSEWSNEPAPAPDPAQSAGLGTVTMSPAKAAALGGLMGRLATLAVGLVALATAYPGWLYAPPNSSSPRNMAWAVIPDLGLKDAAERIQALHESGQMPADPRGLHFYPDLTNYCAWFAPAEKSFFDSRYPLLSDLSADQATVMHDLRDWAHSGEGDIDCEVILRKRGITHVVLAIRGNTGEIMARCFLDDRNWSLWFQNGTVAVFHWRDPELPDVPDPLRENLVKEAFGPADQRLAAPQVLPVPTTAAEDRDFLERYLSLPRSPVPNAAGTALNYTALDQPARRKAQMRADIVFNVADLAAPFAQPRLFNELMKGPRFQTTAEMIVSLDDDAVALSVLAIRAAHRAVNAAPDQAAAWLVLARLYDPFAEVGSQVRSFQLIGALRQGLARATPEDYANPDIAKWLMFAQVKLSEVHVASRQFDLAAECLEQALQMFPKYAALIFPENEIEPRHKVMEQRLTALKEKVLPQMRDGFELNSARRPLNVQATMALQAGLYREALKILEANPEQLDLEGRAMLATIHLTLGQVAEANTVLESVPPLDDPQMRGAAQQFHLLRLQAAIEGGDFARAGKLLDASQANVHEQMSDPITTAAIAMAAQQVHFGDVVGKTPLVRATLLHMSWVTGPLSRLQRLAAQRADLHAKRGILALEEGDTGTALAHLLDAIEPIRDTPAGFPGRGNALAYLALLKKQNPDLYQDIQKKRTAGQ